MIVAVIPAYNEAERISSVIHGAKQHVDCIIVVDDGSSDRTSSVAAQDGALVIHHLENSGAGAATMTGIEVARALRADTIVTLDADEQHDPNDIPKLLRAIEEDGADIVFANRFGQKNNIPSIRRFLNTIGNALTFLATGMWVADSQCGYKALGPKAVKEVDIRMSGYEFCTEIVREAAQHRWRITEVPVRVVYSEYTLAKGQSFAHGIRTALKILLRSFLR